MSRGYSKENTCVHLLNYHFIWCPKYRRPILKGEIKERLGELIKEKVDELNSEILKLKIMPDHVHLFISTKPTISPNKLIFRIKGYSSRIIRDEFKLKSMPTLWTRSYFVSTAGNVSSDTIEKYIEYQTGV